MARYTVQYSVDADDGYVNHDLATIDTATNPWSLILGYNDYDTNGDCDIFAKFSGVNVPKNSIIVNAEIYFNVYLVWKGIVETELKAALNRSTVPGTYTDFTNIVGTSNLVNVHLDPQPLEQILQFNCTNVIQEKINNDDWVQGSNVLIYTDNTSKSVSDAGADIDSYEYNPVMTLIITFDTPDTFDFGDLFNNNRYEYFKYEHLKFENNKFNHNGYLNTISDAEIRVNFNNSIVANASFKIEDSADIDYLRDAIKPWYYLEKNGTIYSFPLGVFLLSSPDRNSNGKNVMRNVQAYDFLKALDDDKLVSSVSYVAGTNAITTVKAILNSVGSWVKFNIEDSTETLAEDLTYESGKSKLFVVNSLLNAINYYPLWADGNGVFMTIEWKDSYNKTWEFLDNENSLYNKNVDLIKNYAEMYNRVVVIAQQLTPDTAPFEKIWTMEDEGMADNPISYTNLGRYITERFYSEATSQDYVDLRARREIRKMLEIEESINYSHAFISSRLNDGLPYNGDAYLFRNSKLGVEAIYKIDSFSWKLRTGELVNAKIRRVTEFED